MFSVILKLKSSKVKMLNFHKNRTANSGNSPFSGISRAFPKRSRASSRFNPILPNDVLRVISSILLYIHNPYKNMNMCDKFRSAKRRRFFIQTEAERRRREAGVKQSIENALGSCLYMFVCMYGLRRYLAI